MAFLASIWDQLMALLPQIMQILTYILGLIGW